MRGTWFVFSYGRSCEICVYSYGGSNAADRVPCLPTYLPACHSHPHQHRHLHRHPPPHPHTSPSLLHPHRRRRRLPPLHHPPRGRVFTRAAEDGNVVVATGPKPPPSPPLPPPPSNTGGEKAASDTATLLWQSGPIRSLERSANPSDRTCKKCQLKVGRDGRVVVARGKEELAVFSSSSVRKLKAFFLVEGGD